MGSKERLVVTFLFAPTLLPKQAEKLPLRERGRTLSLFQPLVVLDFAQINPRKGRHGNLHTPFPISPQLIRLLSQQLFVH